MKFYQKRSSSVRIHDSRIINEIFYGIDEKNREDILENYVFVLQEDKVLQTFSQEEIICLAVDIVPHKTKKRLPFRFENFDGLYDCLKHNHAVPYVGEDRD